MRLPDSFIEQVSQATDIVAVIGTHVSLTLAGQAHKGLCPFHDEKTPSFTVNAARRRFYCFGCAAGGTVFQFLMKQEGLTFHEAVAKMAKAAGIPIPTAYLERQDDTPVFQALDYAAQLYHTTLLRDPAAHDARNYLLSRGLTQDDWVSFRLGYAPTNPEFLCNSPFPKHLKLMHFDAAGLVLRQPRLHDVFQDRIIFPITDLKGRVAGFSGRLIHQDANNKSKGKYVNTTGTMTFKKSSLLYLYDRAVAQREHEKTLILVEGYLDAIALHKAGWTNTVAIMGTALTPSHIDLLQKASWRPMLCLDQDSAGSEATWKTLPALLGSGLKPTVCVLPNGKDPDEFLKTQGAVAFERATMQAVPLFDWACQQIESAKHQGNSDHYVALLQRLRQLINAMPDPMHRHGFHQMLHARFAPGIPFVSKEKPDAPMSLSLSPLERRLAHALTLRWLSPSQLARLQPSWCDHPVIAYLAQLSRAQPDADFPQEVDPDKEAQIRSIKRTVRSCPDPQPTSAALDLLLQQLEQAWARRQLRALCTQSGLPNTSEVHRFLALLRAPSPVPPAQDTLGPAPYGHHSYLSLWEHDGRTPTTSPCTPDNAPRDSGIASSS